MLSFQRYLFRHTLKVLGLILGTLATLTLLAQGLSWTEIIQDNGQTIGIYLKIVVLGAPKVLTLLMPIALFAASVWSLNTLRKDAEITVVQATGMTDWQVASPLMRLAVIVAIAHLAISLWVQPTAQRELRESLLEARTDLATSLIRAGEFTSVSSALTFYARDNEQGVLHGLLISDTSDPDSPIDYIAQEGRMREVNGEPLLVMNAAQIHQKDNDGQLSVIEFEQYTFDLSPFIREETDAVLEASDRYLPELIQLDPTNYVDVKLRKEFTAQVHNRLSTPFLNIALTLLAIWTILGGDYVKTGYARRILRAAFLAGCVFFLHLAVHASAITTPVLNVGQWLIPLGTIAAISAHHFARIGRGTIGNEARFRNIWMQLTRQES